MAGERLYVANERQTGRILVVDLPTMKVVDDFAVASAGGAARDTHFSDLCWAGIAHCGCCCGTKPGSC